MPAAPCHWNQPIQLKKDDNSSKHLPRIYVIIYIQLVGRQYEVSGRGPMRKRLTSSESFREVKRANLTAWKFKYRISALVGPIKKLTIVVEPSPNYVRHV